LLALGGYNWRRSDAAPTPHADPGLTTQIREQLQTTLGTAFTLERELGGGGMSRVFIADEHRLKRKVVVKVLSPELAQGLSVERFEREIQTAAALQQANIVPVFSAGDSHGLPFYMMPWVEGESLRARLGRGPLSVTEVIGIMRDVSKALAYAHRHGVVHRDIKPDNVLLSEGTAVVTDFGIAKAISAARTDSGAATLTQIGTSIGTPAYMAPEQAAGDPAVDQRADIYSLGAMTYELLAGQAMFAGRTPQRVLAAHMGETPKPITEHRSDIPGPLAELVMQCVAKDADLRPQNASDVARVLETITSGGSMPAMPSVLLGGPGMLRKALAIYAVAFVAVAIIARAAIVGIGLPDWVFPGSLIVMALGLPVVLWTGYVQRVARHAATATPTYTPGGTASAATHGTIATMALKAAPHVSWYRTARGGMYAMGAFVFLIGAFMALRALGIGPVGSLLASGELRQTDKVLLTDFSVSGGDTTLGRVVSDAVRAGLGSARSFMIVTPGEMAAALRRMQLPVTAQMTMAIAQQLALREGIKAILDGNVATVGGTYIVSVRLVRADSGRELTSQRATASGAEQLIAAADEVARKLLSKAGESLRRVQRQPALTRATTSSIEALRKYGEGARANDLERDYAKAIPPLREAVALDSNFAEAWRKLGVAMSNQGYPRSHVDSVLNRAYSLRDRLGDVERDYIVAYHFFTGPGRDRGRAIQAYEAILSKGDSNALHNLAFALGLRRDFARSESLLRVNLRRAPSAQLSVAVLAYVLTQQGKQDSFDSLMAVMRVKYPDVTEYRWWQADEVRRKGDVDAFDRFLDSAHKVPDARQPSNAALRLAGRARDRGRLREWLAYELEGTRNDSSVGRREPPVMSAIRQLRMRLTLGHDTARAVREFDAALAKNPLERLPAADRPYFDVASAYAAARRTDRARASLADYQREVLDTAMKRDEAPDVHRALSDIAWAEGRWADAVSEARLGDRKSDGPAHPCAHCLPRQLAWIFADAGMPDSAIAQYEEYRRTGIGGRKRTGPDLELDNELVESLAEMFLIKGDTTRAAQFYAEFIDRWKNADPELQPRVAAAREKLRRMQLDAPKR